MTTPAVHLKREEHARKNHFTIIAYKSDSTDTFMASWSSDFEMSFATTEEDAAIAWADIEDKKLEDREGGYEITLLINGLDYQHDYLEGDDEELELSEIRDRIDTMVQDIRQGRRSAELKQKEEQERIKAIRAEQLKLLAIKDREAEERRHYAILRAKYEGGIS